MKYVSKAFLAAHPNSPQMRNLHKAKRSRPFCLAPFVVFVIDREIDGESDGEPP